MVLTVSGGETFSLSAARKHERNILARLRRSHATKRMYQDLWRDRALIEAVTARHLGLIEPSACNVRAMDTWMIGQFNICIIIDVHQGDGLTATMIFRCPMPHKVGEQYLPGAVEEKMRAEVATYAWIEDNCPTIPIPCLRGFGLSGSAQFTHRTHGTGYKLDVSDTTFNRPYLLLDYVDSSKGKMLSETLKDFRGNDPVRVQNLLRGIGRIMVSLASKTQPRIGSLRFNNDGSTTLTNRPLVCANTILESEGVPRVVDKTYTTGGSFVNDLLRFREEAFRAQPNAVNDEEDCYLQMLHMILMRRLKPHFVDHNSEGPFVLQFTDFHASNIFVDDDWNVTALIDLEFVCALPPAMISAPHWLSVDAIDEMVDEPELADKMHKRFLDTIRHEEMLSNHGHTVGLASAIEHAWESQSCWFYQCFTSINGMAACLEDHLYKKFRFDPSYEEEKRYAKILSSRWSSDSDAFVEQKLRDKAKYNDDLAQHFRINEKQVAKALLP